MLIHRLDINGRAPISFAAFEAQAPRSPRYRFAADSAQVERTYLIPHNEFQLGNPREAPQRIARAFLGRNEVGEQQGVPVVLRMPPLADPTIPKLYAQSIPTCEFLGFSQLRTFLNADIPAEMGGPDVQAPIPAVDREFRNPPGQPVRVPLQHACCWVVTVVYSALTYDVWTDSQLELLVQAARQDVDPGDLLGRLVDLIRAPINDEADAVEFSVPRFVTPLTQTGGRMLTLPAGLMQTVPSAAGEKSDKLPEGTPLPRPDRTLSLTWHNVPEDAVPLRYHHTACQACNGLPFFGYPTGCLMLDGIDTRPHTSPLGDRLIDVTYRFRARVVLDPDVKTARYPNGFPRGFGWVEKVHGGKLVVRKVTSDGSAGGSSPVTYVNFGDLFRPDRPYRPRPTFLGGNLATALPGAVP